MLSPHIVSALLAQREADLRRRAERARLRLPQPTPEHRASGGSTSSVRRRRLRLV